MINMKKQAFNAAAILALTASASSHAALEYLPNGEFNGDAFMGTYADAGAAQFETSGGNPGGYGSIAAGGWGGGFVATQYDGVNEISIALADYGLVGGDTTTFSFDFIDFDGYGNNSTTDGPAFKAESWSATDPISDSGNQQLGAAAADGNWNTLTYTYTFEASATHFKAVLVGNNGGSLGFDNFQIDAVTAAVPVPAAAWLFGSALAGLVAVRRKK
jgi:hypothetical protein